MIQSARRIRFGRAGLKKSKSNHQTQLLKGDKTIRSRGKLSDHFSHQLGLIPEQRFFAGCQRLCKRCYFPASSKPGCWHGLCYKGKKLPFLPGISNNLNSDQYAITDIDFELLPRRCGRRFAADNVGADFSVH